MPQVCGFCGTIISTFLSLSRHGAGDGIGPELTGYVKEAIRFSGAPVDFEELGVNRDSSPAALENALLALARNGVGLKGKA